MNAVLKKLSVGFLLIAPVVGAGCATTYSDALEEYQRNEPTVFHQQTMEWARRTDSEQRATAATTGTLAQPVPAMAESATTSPRLVELEVMNAVFESEVDGLAEKLDTVREPDAMERALQQEVAWEELAPSIAVHNPSVKAAAEQWQATLYQFSQADYLETLVNQYRTFTRYLDVEAGKPLNKEMSKRYFPYPGALSYKSELIGEQARLARLEWEKALRDALLEGGRLFFEYQYLVRAEATTQDNIALLEDLLSVVEERYRVGEADQGDLLKMQTALERQRNMLDDLEDRQVAAAAGINALVDREADAPLGAPAMSDLAATEVETKTLVQRALTHRQEVRKQEARVKRAQAAIRLGEVMNRPTASQGYSVFERGMGPEASVGESKMPFGQMSKVEAQPGYAQAEAYLAEMRQRLQAQRSMLNQARSQTRAMARVWLQEYREARRELQLIEEIVLPQSQSAYDALQSSYAAGRSSFIDLLDAERALIEARLEQDAAQRDLNQVIVRQGAVTGRVPF